MTFCHNGLNPSRLLRISEVTKTIKTDNSFIPLQNVGEKLANRENYPINWFVKMLQAVPVIDVEMKKTGTNSNLYSTQTKKESWQTHSRNKLKAFTEQKHWNNLHEHQ